MNAASLYAWIATVAVGLSLLVIFLLEYDPQAPTAAATRLPVPVISAHALLGLGGLLLWGVYLLADDERVAWATVADLGIVATLGVIMVARWIRVYRARIDSGASLIRVVTVPPERRFPLPAVVAHGVLAVTTVVLVLFTLLVPGQS